MTQLVTRVDDELVGALDDLVEAGVVSSRSDGVREALRALVDRHRRDGVARSIVEGYQRVPQRDEDSTWPDAATVSMIAEEPW
jgi:Arc/MetJ-type ribon-helix-helix transcriptional regulator